MNTPAPADAALELFNQLSDMTIRDGEQAAPIIFRLASLTKQIPGDITARVAYAEALLLSGHREDALEQIDVAYGLRNNATYAVTNRLAMLLFYTVQIEKAKNLIELQINAEGVRAIPGFADNVAMFAFAIGDVELLYKANTIDSAIGNDGVAKDYISFIIKSGLQDHLSTHQRIVLDIVRDSQLWIELFSDNASGSEVAFTSFTHYVLGESSDIRKIQQTIFDTLREYYINHGLRPSVYIPHLRHTLIPIEKYPLMAVA